jgi:hypothetical protein
MPLESGEHEGRAKAVIGGFMRGLDALWRPCPPVGTRAARRLRNGCPAGAPPCFMRPRLLSRGGAARVDRIRPPRARFNEAAAV